MALLLLIGIISHPRKNKMMKAFPLYALIFAILPLLSCGGDLTLEGSLDAQPEIFPDYRDVTVPCNIAPLNFSYKGVEECALLVDGETIRPSDGGKFFFPRRLWKEWMRRDSLSMTLVLRQNGHWMACRPFSIYISHEEIDPYITYRLIPPGYQAWQHMGIYQRELTSYSEKAIITNNLTGGNCLNCHTSCKGDPGRAVFHARAEYGGTMMIRDGKVEKLDTKTDSTISALVYPYWHPEGRYAAFSVNSTKQSFFSHDPNRIEVFDSASDVVVLDTETMEISWSPLTRDAGRCETFPCFSPDGKWLYFCSSATPEQMPRDYALAKYSIWRIAFNEADGSFGEVLEPVFDAESLDRSASFPRISPDGRFLAFTLHSYGNFSIWHKDADLWLTDLQTGISGPMEAFNSEDVESWHCWSSNGRWMVFSSRRDDGLYTRPYIGYVDENGKARKPFLLPQKDPADFYSYLMMSYNLPDFTLAPAKVSKRRLADALRSSDAVKVRAIGHKGK